MFSDLPVMNLPDDTGFSRRCHFLRMVGFFPDRRGTILNIEQASRLLQRRGGDRDRHGRSKCVHLLTSLYSLLMRRPRIVLIERVS